MKIKLKPDVIKEIGIKKFKDLDIEISEEVINWNRNFEIDLAEFNSNQINKLKKLLNNYISFNGIKTIIQEIDIWCESANNINGVKIKKLQHLESLLYKYVKSLPNHWLFQRHSESAWLPYYVSEIEYTPAEKGRDGYIHPAYVDISVVYNKFSLMCKNKFTFYRDDVIGMTIDQLLLKFNLFKSTDKNISEYEKDYNRYKILINKIGSQFTVNGNADDDIPNDERGWYSATTFTFSNDRRKNRVVIDSFYDEENEKKGNNKDVCFSKYYWIDKKLDDDSDVVEEPIINIPTHPFLIIFDLFRHLRLSVHTKFLKEYEYDTQLADKLILDKHIKYLINMLVSHKEGNFKDIVAGKGGGAIILLTGRPGVGKTLTAEVFAEADKKPLYSVQASQLGVNPEELEKNLMTVLRRSARWNAILLLDEADVYVHERGNDLTQNAIVGVFLRILEYHSSILFLTSNRPDLVDDAIASRCIARIDYTYPSVEKQIEIWRVLSETASINIEECEYAAFAKDHPNISGRDVKNLLKLANLISIAKNIKITNTVLNYVLKFKPTVIKND